MKIDKAEISSWGLILTVPLTDARRFVYGFKPGEYEIKKARKKRSNDANAYAWKLINDIALAIRVSPNEVYRRALEDIPCISEDVIARSEAVSAIERTWTSGHIGRRVEKEPSAARGYSNVRLYFGSSDFDTKQMSMLIDNLIQDCKAIGIETRPEEEINALLEAWNGR